MRRFVGIDLGASRCPTRPPYATFGICWKPTTWAISCLYGSNESLQENGLKVSSGTIVDAPIIDAPNSTETKDKARDPEMHQTKRGNRWYFSMKAHIGDDSRSELIQSVAATAATVHDSQLLGDLLHGDETRVWTDLAYAGQGDTIREHARMRKTLTIIKEAASAR
jgi:IS5 family transposase